MQIYKKLKRNEQSGERVNKVITDTVDASLLFTVTRLHECNVE